jgi:hypothetical protein
LTLTPEDKNDLEVPYLPHASAGMMAQDTAEPPARLLGLSAVMQGYGEQEAGGATKASKPMMKGARAAARQRQ